MPSDVFSQNDSAILSPYTRAVEITPSDTEDLDEVTRALNVYGSGNHHAVKVKMLGGGDPVIIYTANGGFVNVRVTRVYETDTTATSIVALY